MKCYCYETDLSFIFCAEDVESTQLESMIRHKGWKEIDGKFLMPYPQHMFTSPRDKELMNDNFARFGQAMFKSGLFGFDWEKPLELLSQKFKENEIEWYIVGSVSDTVRGVDVIPGDIDIVIHTRDYDKVKNICYSHYSDSIMSPFTDNRGLFPLRFIGRLFLAGALFEIAADEEWNMENRKPTYEMVSWNGFDLYVDALQLRYDIERGRKREDRIKAIEAYMNHNKLRSK